METIPITHGHITSPTHHHVSFTAGICTGEVAAEVAKFFSMSLQTLIGRGRTEQLALARQIAMALAYKYTYESQREVADYFGREHSTVSHACTVVENLTSCDHRFRRQVEMIEQRLGRPNIGRVVT